MTIIEPLFFDRFMKKRSVRKLKRNHFDLMVIVRRQNEINKYEFFLNDFFELKTPI